MEQSVVDFIVEQLDVLHRERKENLIDVETFFKHKKELINQAKEIFEKQIINAYNQGVYLAMKPSKRAEDYYDKTFKSE